MIVNSTVVMPDGRAYELSLEPLFDDKRQIRDFRCHMIWELAKPQTHDDKQAEIALGLVG